MKSVRTVLVLLTLLASLVAGCSKSPSKPKISELQRKQADHLAAEAQFAMTMKDWAGAEKSLTQATQLVPDTGGLWVSLGSVRVRLGNKSGAKAAYESALKAFKADAETDPKDPEPWLKQMQVLALLGRTSDARAQLERTAKQFPDHRSVRAFIEGKQLDRMLADPLFKEGAL
jgi:Flp pilus assembly protein TadD